MQQQKGDPSTGSRSRRDIEEELGFAAAFAQEMVAPQKSTKNFPSEWGGGVRSTGLRASFQRALGSLEVPSPPHPPLDLCCPHRATVPLRFNEKFRRGVTCALPITSSCVTKVFAPA
jgi:hypothetical protein